MDLMKDIHRITGYCFLMQNLQYAHFLAPNVYQYHKYDDEISDEVWDNTYAMYYRENSDTGLTDVCQVGLYNEHYFMIMISHFMTEDTVKIFHLMPLTPDDAEMLDFDPGSAYTYPKEIVRRGEEEPDDWWQ